MNDLYEHCNRFRLFDHNDGFYDHKEFRFTNISAGKQRSLLSLTLRIQEMFVKEHHFLSHK